MKKILFLIVCLSFKEIKPSEIVSLQVIPQEVIKTHILPCMDFYTLIKLSAINKFFSELTKEQILITYFLFLDTINPDFKLPENQNNYDIIEFFWHLDHFNEPYLSMQHYGKLARNENHNISDVYNYINQEHLTEGITCQCIDIQKLQNDFSDIQYAYFINKLKNKKLFIYNTPVIEDYNYEEQDCFHWFKEVTFNGEKDNYPPNFSDKYGQTSLFKACFKDNPQKINALLEQYSFDVNLQDHQGSTPLEVACAKGFVEIVQILLHNNAKVNVQNKNGFFPLFRAAYKGHVNIAEILIENGANVNLQGKNKRTPLHEAYYQENEGMVGLLLDYGADLTIEDTHGHIPEDLYSHNGINRK